MFRKVLVASIIGFMLSSTLVATSASAATIRNGVACPKSKMNKYTKVGSSVYKCTKNPAVKNAKLTWVSRDCLNSNTSYAKSNTAYLALAKRLPAVLAALDVNIAAEIVKEQEATAKADALDVTIATLKDKLIQFTAWRNALIADTANAGKWAPKIAQYTLAIKNLNSAIHAYTASVTLYRSVGKTVGVLQATRATTISELGQAKDGVAQARTLRGLLCSKGM